MRDQFPFTRHIQDAGTMENLLDACADSARTVVKTAIEKPDLTEQLINEGLVGTVAEAMQRAYDLGMYREAHK